MIVMIGADVTHPAAHTSGIPSYASLVGSVDSHAVKYVAVTRAQESRQEWIGDFKSMCLVSGRGTVTNFKCFYKQKLASIRKVQGVPSYRREERSK